MSKFKFGNVAAQDPRGGRSWFTLPTMPPLGDLELKHAGSTNKPYVNAVSKRNAKTGLAKRISRGRVTADDLEQGAQIDRELYPTLIVSNWRGVKDEDGKEVPFSTEACIDFFAVMPDWLVREVTRHAEDPVNFLPDDMPTEDEVEQAAGN